MIPSGVDIFVAVEPVDLRCGFNRLSGMARDQLGYEPRCGALFVFFGKRQHAVKILFFDGSGLCLFYKRLDSGRFRVPKVGDGDATHVEIDEATLDALLDGIDVEEDRGDGRRRRIH